MLEILGSIDSNIIKALGMAISGLTGLIMSWISKRSVNYRKIDKKVVLASFLYFIILNIMVMIMLFIAAIIGSIFIYVGLIETFASMIVFSMVMGLISILIFWGAIIRMKIFKFMMEKAKSISNALFLLINGLSMISVILSFLILPYIMTENEGIITTTVEVISWVLLAWWFSLMVSFVWRTAKYVYSEMKITLLDGEVIIHSCSPQMCRVHKHYIRLLERDNKGVIIYERHVHEAAVKQIEYT